MNEPRILRWQDQMGTVAARWKNQYFHKGGWGTTFHGNSEVTYNRLLALPADATPADVKNAIGTEGWVTFWCNGCNDYAPVVIELGDQPDYESATVTLCLACFDKAVELRKTVDAAYPVAPK